MPAPESVGARHAVPVLDGFAPSVSDLVGAQHAALSSEALNLSSRVPNLLSRAKRGVCFFLGLFLTATSFVAAQTPPARPKILGISFVRIYSTDIVDALRFYPKTLLPPGPCPWCEEGRPPLRIPVNREQTVVVTSAPNPTPANLLGEIQFATDDLGAMKQFLIANKIPFSSPKGEGALITLSDPEGRHIGFALRASPPSSPSNVMRLHLIHAGFIVRDRAATEHFYKDILGFRPYWHGGMKEGQDDWVSLQVPDGTDWLEFMVNVSPDADQRLRGIMNHIAIGVTDIHANEQRLRDAGLKLTEKPQIGRDGKWQLNLYDPHLTRVEFMEFKPVQKPCCSEFTGPHPGPKQ